MSLNDFKLNIRTKCGNIFERFVPKAVKSFLFFTLGSIRRFFLGQLVFKDSIIDFSQKDKHIFFGYYDISPFSSNGNYLLAMRAPLIEGAPTVNDEAEIGYFEISKDVSSFVLMCKTNTWCWQQGCRLQWFAGRDDAIICNSLVNGNYGADIREFSSGRLIKRIEKPLYSITADGKWGVTLNFSRLQRLRPGYGYGVLPDSSKGELKPDNDGIELVDLETGEARLLFSLKTIAGIKPHDTMTGAEHYFNHLMFNPSGNRFLFFHLWTKKNKRYSRLFVSDREGTSLQLINNSGCVSHYNWISEDEIILYSLVEEKNKLMYAVFDSRNGNVRFLPESAPEQDGHPTFISGGKIMITDTYPDLCSQRNLLFFDIVEGKKRILARFDSPVGQAGEFRCDLHPRISKDERYICVDRFLNGRRCMSLIPINVEKS